MAPNYSACYSIQNKVVSTAKAQQANSYIRLEDTHVNRSRVRAARMGQTKIVFTFTFDEYPLKYAWKLKELFNNEGTHKVRSLLKLQRGYQQQMYDNKRKDQLRNKWRIKGIVAIKHIRPRPRTKLELFLFTQPVHLNLFLFILLYLCHCICLRLLSSFVCSERFKGATSLVASLRNQSRGLYKYTADHVWVRMCILCVCVWSQMCSIDWKFCVTDNCGRQMASLNGIGQLTPGHQQISWVSHQKGCLGVLIKV